MTSSFTLAHTDIFYDSPVDLYENEEHEIFMTALQLSNCLEGLSEIQVSLRRQVLCYSPVHPNQLPDNLY